MQHNQTYRFSRSAAQLLVASIVLALLTLVCFRLRLNLAMTVGLYLIVIVLLSLQGSFLASAVVSLIAGLCLEYSCVPPRFYLRMDNPLDAVAVTALLTSGWVITRLLSEVRNSQKALEKSFEEIQALKDQLRPVIDIIPAQVWSVVGHHSVNYANQCWMDYPSLSLEDCGWRPKYVKV